MLDMYSREDKSATGMLPMLSSIEVSSILCCQAACVIPSAWIFLACCRSGNALTGSIPAALQLPANLQYLFLANNSLSGELPSYLPLPPSLRGLDLFNNRLSGGLPPNLTEWLPEGLYYLDLHGNSLSGKASNALELPLPLRSV